MKRPFEFDLADCLGGELLEAPPAKVEKVEPVVAPASPPKPVVTPPPPPPASPVPPASPLALASPPVSRPRTPDPMAVLSPAHAELAALLNSSAAPPVQQHYDAPTSSETPPRCPTPDPLSMLSPEQAMLASLINGGALGDEAPRKESGAVVPNWHRNGSPGILREDGGVKQWMSKLNL